MPKRPLTFIGGWIALACLLVGMLFASQFLPQEPIKRNIERSVIPLLELSNLSPEFSLFAYEENYYDDAYMLNIAVIPDTISLIDDLVYAPVYLDLDEVDGDPAGAATSLLVRADTWPITNREYYRYWHGYKVPLRILMQFFDYRIIRILGVISAALALMALLILLWRNVSRVDALIVFLVLSFFGFNTVSLSISFLPAFFIAIVISIACLILVKRYPVASFDLELFAVSGMLISFFELWSIPLITWGIPIIILLSSQLRSKTLRTYWQGALLVFRSLGAWFLSYSVFWASKWVLVGMFGGKIVLKGIFDSITLRSSAAEGLFTRLKALGINIFVMLPIRAGTPFPPTWLILLGLLIVFCLLVMVWYILCKRTGDISMQARRAFPLFIIALMPFVWILLLPEHSMRHFFFVFRMLIVSVLAIAFLFRYSIPWDKLHSCGKLVETPD